LAGAFGFVMAAIGAVPAQACDDPLRVGVTDWPPFDMPTADGVTGINSDILRAAGKRLGCELTFHKRPWGRLLDELRSGELDVTGAAHRTPDREAYARFSKPYLPYKSVLFVDESDERTYGRLRQFLAQGRSLAVIRGYTYGKATDELLAKPAYAGQVFEMYAADESVRALTHDRVAGMLGNPHVLRYFARKQNVRGDIRRTDAVVQNTPVHFMFSEASVPDGFVDRFNAALMAVKRGGRLDAIVQEHIHGADDGGS
jgi:polar amino acid transport system substrate-binding protein